MTTFRRLKGAIHRREFMRYTGLLGLGAASAKLLAGNYAFAEDGVFEEFGVAQNETIVTLDPVHHHRPRQRPAEPLPL